MGRSSRSHCRSAGLYAQRNVAARPNDVRQDMQVGHCHEDGSSKVCMREITNALCKLIRSRVLQELRALE